MQKLKLDLDALKVDSFQAETSTPATRGTVAGHIFLVPITVTIGIGLYALSDAYCPA